MVAEEKESQFLKEELVAAVEDVPKSVCRRGQEMGECMGSREEEKERESFWGKDQEAVTPMDGIFTD